LPFIFTVGANINETEINRSCPESVLLPSLHLLPPSFARTLVAELAAGAAAGPLGLPEAGDVVGAGLGVPLQAAFLAAEAVLLVPLGAILGSGIRS
jgi:hypothetical protein